MWAAVYDWLRRHLFNLVVLTMALFQVIDVYWHSRQGGTYDWASLIFGMLIALSYVLSTRYRRLGLSAVTAICLIAVFLPTPVYMGAIFEIALTTLGLLGYQKPFILGLAIAAIDVFTLGYSLDRLSFYDLSVLGSIYLAVLLIGYTIRSLNEKIALTRELGETKILRYRQQLAHHIHDSITHSLVKIKLLADKNENSPDMQQISCISESALEQLRMLIYQMSTEVVSTDSENDLPQVGLRKYLLSLASDARSVGLTPEYEIIGSIENLSPSLSKLIERICIEFSTNAMKHASRSRSVALTVSVTPQQVRIYSANGVNVNSASIRSNHLGLAGIKRSVEALGGSIQIATEDEIWSCTVRIPISKSLPQDVESAE